MVFICASTVTCMHNVQKGRKDTSLRRVSGCYRQARQLAIFSHCVLQIRKSRIQATLLLSRLNWSVSFKTSRRVWILLKAEEKSANSSLVSARAPKVATDEHTLLVSVFNLHRIK